MTIAADRAAQRDDDEHGQAFGDEFAQKGFPSWHDSPPVARKVKSVTNDKAGKSAGFFTPPPSLSRLTLALRLTPTRKRSEPFDTLALSNPLQRANAREGGGVTNPANGERISPKERGYSPIGTGSGGRAFGDKLPYPASRFSQALRGRHDIHLAPGPVAPAGAAAAGLSVCEGFPRPRKAVRALSRSDAGVAAEDHPGPHRPHRAAHRCSSWRWRC